MVTLEEFPSQPVLRPFCSIEKEPGGFTWSLQLGKAGALPRILGFLRVRSSVSLSLAPAPGPQPWGEAAWLLSLVPGILGVFSQAGACWPCPRHSPPTLSSLPSFPLPLDFSTPLPSLEKHLLSSAKQPLGDVSKPLSFPE